MHLIPRASLLALALSLAPHVQAHNPLAGELEERLAGLLTALLLLGFWLVYSLGARRVRTARWRQVLFHATALLSVLALLGPLDDWAKTSTAAHMAQHMLLMVVIAPLWVFSRPLPALSAMTRRIGPFLWTPLLRLTARAHHLRLAARAGHLVLAPAAVLHGGCGEPLVACAGTRLFSAHSAAVLVVRTSRR